MKLSEKYTKLAELHAALEAGKELQYLENRNLDLWVPTGTTVPDIQSPLERYRIKPETEQNNDELFDAASLAAFYTDLAEHGGKVQVLAAYGWKDTEEAPSPRNRRNMWRVYREPVPREFWINEYTPEEALNSRSTHDSKELADICAGEDRICCIHVREVL